jgi:hypothetical protein
MKIYFSHTPIKPSHGRRDQVSNEKHFCFSGSVNEQNYRQWAPENPLDFHQRPVHSDKLTDCCGIASVGVLALTSLKTRKQQKLL